MALPAGRYGVTKNQLLKIKKLPMNTMGMIKDTKEGIAIIEDGAKASQLITAGCQFWHNGKLYSADVDIAKDADIITSGEGKNATLSDSVTEQIKAVKDGLGTASAKNSTSVVTDSTDLVESGAVFDALGWGNKNLLPNKAKPQTVSGVTFTVNDDGSLTVNGTSTAVIYYNIVQNITLPNGSYLFSGTNNGSNETYFLYLTDTHGNTFNYNGDTNYVVDNGTGSIVCTLTIRSGQTFNNVKFYPMVSKEGGAYEPYHASVEESLEQKCDTSAIAPTENGTTASQAYAVGEHFIRNGAFCTVTQPISSGGTLTEGTNYTSGDVADDIYGKIIIPIAGTNTSLQSVNCRRIGRIYFINTQIHTSADIVKNGILLSIVDSLLAGLDLWGSAVLVDTNTGDIYPAAIRILNSAINIVYRGGTDEPIPNGTWLALTCSVVC